MATKLYVGNLAPETTAEHLRAVFAGEGRRVVDVVLACDRFTQEPRGYAFVEMASPDDAERALVACAGVVVAGRPLLVNAVRPRTPGGGGRTTGRGRGNSGASPAGRS